MSGPNSAPEIGQQNYRTGQPFLESCCRRFGIKEFFFDLACTTQDCIGTEGGFTYPEIDALKEDWTFLAQLPGTSFFNPPFAQSGAFAAKAASSGAHIVGLVPVAIGTQWWQQHVHRKAVVVGVGRLVFNTPEGTPVLGKTGKPQAINRDCAVLAYNILPPGTEWYLLESWRTW